MMSYQWKHDEIGATRMLKKAVNMDKKSIMALQLLGVISFNKL